MATKPRQLGTGLLKAGLCMSAGTVCCLVDIGIESAESVLAMVSAGLGRFGLEVGKAAAVGGALKTARHVSALAGTVNDRVNHDLFQLAADAINESLRRSMASLDPKADASIIEVIDRLSQTVTSNWLDGVYKGERQHGPRLCEKEIVDLFKAGHATGGTTPKVGTAKQWANFLYEHGPQSENVPSDEQLERVGALVRTHFAASIRDAARTHFADGKTGYPALVLRMLSEICQSQQRVVDQLSVIEGKIDALAASQTANAKAAELSQKIMRGIEREDIRELLEPLGNSISALSDEIRAQHDRTRKCITATIERARRGGIPLLIPANVSEPNSRFYASARRVRMHGREREQRWISAFLDDESQFSWASIVGHGGVGKTRLAIDTCLKLDGAWVAGLVVRESYDALPTWAGPDAWLPEAPTLIIFDYVAYGEHATKIHDAIHGLASRMSVLKHKVRVLVLERPEPGLPGDERTQSDSQMQGPVVQALPRDFLSGGWWLSVVGDGNAGALVGSTYTVHLPGSARRDRSKGPAPIELKGLDRDMAMRVLEELLAILGKTIDSDTLRKHMATVEQVVPDFRPLYLAFAAEAIAAGTLVSSWKTRDLMEFVLTREKSRWKHVFTDGDAGMRERYERLLLLATACDHLPLAPADGQSILDTIGDGDWFPRPSTYGNGERLSRLVPGASALVAPKLEPDPLGECFVLTELDSRHTPQTRRIACHARRLRPDGHADFLRRAAKNQPDHPALDHLLDPTFCPATAQVGEGEATAIDQPAIAVFVDLLLTRLGSIAPTETALFERVYDTALACGWVTPLGREKMGVIASGRTGVTTTSQGETTSPDPAMLASTPDTQTKEPAEPVPVPDQTAIPTDPSIATLRAMVLSRATATSDITIDTLMACVRALETLARGLPEVQDIRASYAIGLSNAVAATENDNDRIDGFLGELFRLHADAPGDAAVREQLASALFNAHHKTDRGPGRGDDLLGKLRRLHADAPDDAAVREPLAKALNNAVVATKNDNDRIDGFLGELRRLHADAPDDAAVRERLAKALYNAHRNTDRGPGRGDDLLDELRRLHADAPDDAAVRENLATALGASIMHANSAGNAARAADRATELASHKDAVLSQPGMVLVFKGVLDDAIALARAQHNADALDRLTAARDTIFGP